MDKNTVIFKIYKCDIKGELSNEDYIFNLNIKIIDIKKEILKKTFNNEYNYLDLENVTERVYKDFGKLFFDKGILPSTIDNYKLEEFTNDNRTFSFIALPKNIEINQKLKEDSGFLKKIVKKQLKNNQLFIYDDDFPPL
jgi:hypothetical protein